jgi:dolichol-phosphate mannosyltransferase
MKIGIIIPTLNEELNIIQLIEKIDKNLSKKYDYYIAIIDDSLEDKITSKIDQFKNKIKYIHRGKKMGRGSAILSGMQYFLENSSTDIIIEMDADLSHDPDELDEKINLFLNNNYDILIASRYLKDSKIINWSIKRKILSFLSNKLAKFFLKIPVSDYTNGFRIYSVKATRHIINNCGKIGDGFIILSEILMELYYNNFKLGEHYTIFRNRVRGKSNVNINLIILSLLGLLKLIKIKISKY